MVTRKAKPIELLAYRLTIARDIALLASIASCLVVLCSVIAAWLSREVEERGGTDSLAGLGIDSTTARQLTRLLLPGAGLDAPDGDSAAATGGSLSLHNPACPWSVWLGAGALLLCALLGVASILAWALGLIPDDFEVQWPRNCQCFVFAGPLVLLAAAVCASLDWWWASRSQRGCCGAALCATPRLRGCATRRSGMWCKTCEA